jgi:hypothetical protein
MLSEIGTRLKEDLNTARTDSESKRQKCTDHLNRIIHLEKKMESMLRTTKLLAQEQFCPETSTERRRAIGIEINNLSNDIDVIRAQIETEQLKNNTATQDYVKSYKLVLHIMEQLEENEQTDSIFEKPNSVVAIEIDF